MSKIELWKRGLLFLEQSQPSISLEIIFKLSLSQLDLPSEVRLSAYIKKKEVVPWSPTRHAVTLEAQALISMVGITREKEEKKVEDGELLLFLIRHGLLAFGEDVGLLREGGVREGTLSWHVAESGIQTPTVLFAEPAVPLLVAPLLYFDAREGAVGKVSEVRTGLTSDHKKVNPVLVAWWVKGPRVHPDSEGATTSLLVPPLPVKREQRKVPLQPVLFLSFGKFIPKVSAKRAHPFEAPVAWCAMRYGNTSIVPGTGEETRYIHTENEIVPIRRELKEEEASMAYLFEKGFYKIEAKYPEHQLSQRKLLGVPLTLGSEKEAWLSAAETLFSALKMRGWHIEMCSDYPYRFVSLSSFELEWMNDEQESWTPRVWAKVGEKRKEVTESFRQTLNAAHQGITGKGSTGKEVPIAVDGEGEGLLSLKVLRTINNILPEFAFSNSFSKESMGAINVALQDELPDWKIPPLSWKQNPSSLPLPQDFPLTLREYQKEGVDWLYTNLKAGHGCLLADEMGLGKTIQILAFLRAIEETPFAEVAFPVLIVCPTSLLFNWRDEAAKVFSPEALYLFYGERRRDEFPSHPRIVLTSYPLVIRDKEYLSSQSFSLGVLDEAQQVKNAETQTYTALNSLGVTKWIALSGTPLENRLRELWTLFSIVSPSLLGGRKDFENYFARRIEQSSDGEALGGLKRRLSPFLLRRTKRQVVRELPEKVETVVTIPPSSAQLHLLRTLGTEARELLETSPQRTTFSLLTMLLRLRQGACDPRLVDPSGEDEGGKIKALRELLPELLTSQRRVLIFSQFVSFLGIIEDLLQSLTIKYALLTGDTDDREGQVQLFQSLQVPVFLISLKAGGVGLNLTSADTVILCDPWWNPAVEAQAIDRAHRIGQKKTVFIYRLVTQGSIEERVRTLQKNKMELFTSVMEEEEVAQGLTREDFLTLLQE